MGWELWKVWENTVVGSRNSLRKFLHDTQSIPTLSKGVVREMLQLSPLEKHSCQSHKDVDDETLLIVNKHKTRYFEAHNGDHLAGIPFQYDVCYFRNLDHRNSISNLPRDRNTSVAICRANVDSF